MAIFQIIIVILCNRFKYYYSFILLKICVGSYLKCGNMKNVPEIFENKKSYQMKNSPNSLLFRVYYTTPFIIINLAILSNDAISAPAA